MSTPVIFRGIKFPFQRGPTSFPRQATDEELINDALIQLILTSVGERVMRPGAGSNALALVFENNDEILASLLRTEIYGVIAKYEPRVTVSDVLIERQQEAVIATIIYIINASGRVANTTMAIQSP
jgi:phage baseplate assembly protein W